MLTVSSKIGCVKTEQPISNGEWNL